MWARRRTPLPSVGGRAMALGCLLSIVGLQLCAFDEFAYDVRLAKVLSQIQMYDYALRHLDEIQKQYPDRLEEISVERARALYLTGKRGPADECLAKIGPNSPHFGRSRLALGEAAASRGDLATAKQAYGQYFGKSTAPSGTSEDDIEEFKTAVLRYVHILQQDGNGAEAAKVMGYLGNIKGEEGASQRQLVFLKNKAVLDAEDQKLMDGKEVNKAAIAEAVKALDGLQWQGVDAVAAAALTEVAHGRVLLGEHQKAIDAIGGADEIMVEVENVLRKQGSASASPIAGALYYVGRAQKGLALEAFKQKKTDESKELLTAALKRFYKVTKEYRSSPYGTPALAEFSKCRNLLEKEFGVTVKARTGGDEDAEFEAKMQQGLALFSAKRYADAGECYLDALRRNRLGERLPEAGLRLVVCLGKQDRFLEAEAVASYLEEGFRTAPDTADAFLKLGALLLDKGKTETDAARREQWTGRAMAAWDRFVDLNPAHASAPDIAFSVAEDGYRRASEVARQAAEAKDAATKEKLKQTARDLYLAAVPGYQRVIERFATREKGVRALYKLGWIHYTTDQKKEAADAFLRYAEAEVNPKLAEDRMEAKFRAAEELMLCDLASDAATHLTELLDWFRAGAPQGLDLNAPRVKRLREDASSYLGWAYDLAGEAFRPRLTEVDQRLDDCRRLSRDAEAALAELEKHQKQADSEIATARQEFAEMEKLVAATAAADTELAKALAQARGENLEGMSEQEKEVAKRNAAELAQRISSGMAARERERLAGEKLVYEGQREKEKAETASLTERVARLDGALAEARQRLGQLQERAKKASAEHEALTRKEGELHQQANAAQADVNKCEQDLADANEKKQSDDLKVQEEAEKARQAAATARQAATTRLKSLQDGLTKLVTPEYEAKRKGLVAAMDSLTRDIEQQTRDLAGLEKERALVAKRQEVCQARVIAVAKTLDRNELDRRLLDVTPDERQAQAEQQRKLHEEALTAFRTATEQRVAEAELVKRLSGEDAAARRQDIERAQEQMAALEKERAPLRTSFEKAKRKAQEQFLAFLKEYASSKHVPDNMARLGVVFIEFREFDKAAEYLDRLAKQFPDAEAGKRALFSLGRAQFEIGQKEKAAASFAKLLETSEDQSTANLAYISENMLAAGHPKESLAATQELLKRSEDKTRPDAETLAGVIRENALFRAGEASFRLEKYPEALERYERLLTERPRTPYFFEAKFRCAAARRRKPQPDTEGAIRDYAEILQFATDTVMSNRALCEIGDIYVGMPDPENQKLGLARFQQIVLLADTTVAENLPLVEKAVFESARTYARLGDTEQRDKMVARYRELFPDGKYRNELPNLSGGGAGPPAPGAAPPPAK